MKPNTVITISREYGSGGRIIGKKLAELLQIPFYDNELITIAAEKSGISKEYFKDAESASVGNILFSLSNLSPITTGNEIYGLPLNEKIFLVQSKVIKQLAEESSCVIVGRCADYILQDFPNCTNIFIHAELEDRVNRAINDYQLPHKNAESVVLKTDKKRASYYSYFTNQKWGRTENYELVLNSSKIGIDNAVEVIKYYVHLKEKNCNDKS